MSGQRLTVMAYVLDVLMVLTDIILTLRNAPLLMSLYIVFFDKTPLGLDAILAHRKQKGMQS